MQTKFGTMGRYSWGVVVGLALGCSGEAADEGSASRDALDFQGQSFADVIPAEHHTSVTLVEQESGSKALLPQRGELAKDGEPVAREAGAIIDADGGRAYFPMPRDKQSFRNKSELIQFVVDKFGADEVVTDPKTGEIVAARGSYVQRGDSIFEDTDLGVTFHVREPILAYVAGVSGIIEMEGQDACMDPDGECGSERASYLDIEGEETRPTHVDRCGGNPNHCSQFHSFFNKLPFVSWARHGTNVKITGGAYSSTNRLAASGFIFSEMSFWPMPSARTVGESSAETAVWSIGSPETLEYKATAVCGESSDSSIGAALTGNGPENTMRCGR